MKELAWTTAFAVTAAVCGWIWTTAHPVEPQPVVIERGASIGGLGSSAAESGSSPEAVGSASSRYSPSGSARGSAAGSGPRGTRGPSDHEQVTIAAPCRIARADGGYLVNFPYLASFRALMVDPASPSRALVPAPIPAGVAELDGAEVELRGFMTPLRVERSRTLEFLLTRYSIDQCCMGKVPMPNEWVVVNVAAEHAIAPVSQGTVNVWGRFSVGPEFNEAGEMLSLYRLVAVRVEVVH